jgi:hypothetical protein
MVKMNQISSIDTVSSSKWLWVALVLTIIATVWSAMQGDKADDTASADLLNDKNSSDAPHVIVRSSSADQINQSYKAEQIASLGNSGLISWQKLKREPIQHQAYDLFKVHSWVVVPPVKKVKPVPPPPPVAPPAPFEYLGKYGDSTKGALIFLMANNKLYSVTVGEKIDSQWRLDAEDAGALHLTFLPLNLPQILSKSAKLAAIPPVAAAEISQ